MSRTLATTDWRSLFLLCVFGLCCTEAVRAAEPVDGESPTQRTSLVLRRWAVLSDESCRDAGISDLLTAELSAVPGLELVERDDVEAVVRELELASVLGTHAGAERLRLGRLLKADVLLILKQAEQDGVSFLQWTIAECSLGARLMTNAAPLDSSQPERALFQIVQDVQKTCERFADGVEQLIAVAPFLSNDLTHEHDQLQHGLATILGESLLAFPGVAVLEIDEARAIAAELDRDSDAPRSQVRRLFVSGSYSTGDLNGDRKSGGRAEPQQAGVRHETDDRAVRVRVKLSLRDSRGRSLETLVVDESSSRVLDQFRTTIPERILKQSRSTSAPVLTASQQRKLLAERSQRFAQLGAWRQSIPLREAALLLEPDDAVLRVALIADARLLMTQRFSLTLRAPAAERTLQNAEQLALFRRAAPHVEWLIRNRRLSMREAASLVHRISLRLRHHYHGGSAETKQAVDELFWRVAASFQLLKTSIDPPEIADELVRFQNLSPATAATIRQNYERDSYPRDQHIETLANAALNVVLEVSPHCNRFVAPTSGNRLTATDDRETLDGLYRVLTEVIPTDQPYLHVIAMLTRSQYNGVVKAIRLRRFSAEEFSEIISRLRTTDERVLHFYADISELALRAWLDHSCSNLSTAELQQRVRTELARLPNSLPISQLGVRYAEDLNEQLEARAKALASRRGESMPDRAASGRSGRTLGSLQSPIPLEEPRSRVHFEPLDGPVPDWWEIIPMRPEYAPAFDVVWSRYTVSVMHEPGRLKPIFELERPRQQRRELGSSSDLINELDEDLYALTDDMNGIHDVRCAGEFAWIVTTRTGIRVVSLRDGRQWQIDEDAGLPPYDVSRHPATYGRLRRPVLLHPSPDGSCLAIGKQGKHSRLWFAWIKLPGRETRTNAAGRPSVEVFHTATHLAGTSPDAKAGDSYEIFEPTWVVEMAGEEGRRKLLVNRLRSRPLVIDVEDRSVSVLPPSLPEPGLPLYEPVKTGNRLLIPLNAHLYEFEIPESSASEWLSKSLYVGMDSEGGKLRRPPHYLRNPLVQTGDVAWCPGGFWIRVDLRNGDAERLNENTLPLREQFERYGLSVHHGLVAWNRGDRLYRVIVDSDSGPLTATQLSSSPEDGDAEASLKLADSEFSFVPEVFRLRHAQGVAALEKLGAHADSVWWRSWVSNAPRVSLRSGRSFAERKWFTVVWFDENWTGGDDGLRHLQDLHGPLVVYLANAPVTDAGMKLVGRLGEGNPMSVEPPSGRINYGNSRIAPSGNGLTMLFLEGTSVTDRGLVELQRLPFLRQLHLDSTDDPGRLTDTGFVKLAERLPLERITLRGGGFTDASLKQLADSPTLHGLVLFQTSLTPGGWQSIKQRRPWIQIEER